MLLHLLRVLKMPAITNYLPASAAVSSCFATSTSTSPLVYADANTMVVSGNFIINGEDLNDRLCRIEQLLGIPQRSIDLEKEFPKLKRSFDEYILILNNFNCTSPEIRKAREEYELAVEQYQTWSILSAE
jgi:hypothetical protein